MGMSFSAPEIPHGGYCSCSRNKEPRSEYPGTRAIGEGVVFQLDCLRTHEENDKLLPANRSLASSALDASAFAIINWYDVNKFKSMSEDTALRSDLGRNQWMLW